jgi:hypothetical protein
MRDKIAGAVLRTAIAVVLAATVWSSPTAQAQQLGDVSIGGTDSSDHFSVSDYWKWLAQQKADVTHYCR